MLLLSAAFAWLLGQTAAQMCLLSAAAASIAALAVAATATPAACQQRSGREKRLSAQLQMASDALLQLHVLAPAAMEDTDPDAAEIFDRATEAVCRTALAGGPAGSRRAAIRITPCAAPLGRCWPNTGRCPRIFRRRSAPAASSWMHFCRRSTANWTGSYTGGTGPAAGESRRMLRDQY